MMVTPAASWTLSLLVPVTLIFFAIYLFYRKKFKYWGELNFPHTNPKFPFGDFGKMFLSEGIYSAQMKIYSSFKGEKAVGIWSFFFPLLFVIDLDLIKEVLVKNFTSFHDRGVYVDEKNDPLFANLFTLAGAKWRYLRTKISPTFTPSKLKIMFPILVQCSDVLIEVLDKPATGREIIELKEYSARFTTDIIASCAFGIQANSLKDPKAIFREMGKKAMEPSLINAIKTTFFFNPKIAKFFKIRYTNQIVNKYFLKLVKETIDYRKANNVQRNDFLQLLIQLMDEGKIDDVDDIEGTESEAEKSTRKITFEEAAAVAYGFFNAGFETSSSVIQFALYELALNPNIQEELRAEIKSVTGKCNNSVTFEGIHEMELLGRVVDETVRKYPTPFVNRTCNKDFKINGTDMVVPKGTKVTIPVYAIHHDPVFYPKPENFDPDRFREENKSKLPQYAYLPFGSGPRNCIGTKFGLMQVKLGLVKLLLHYKFEICEKSLVPMILDPKGGGFNSAKNGMYLRISKFTQ